VLVKYSVESAHLRFFPGSSVLINTLLKQGDSRGPRGHQPFQRFSARICGRSEKSELRTSGGEWAGGSHGDVEFWAVWVAEKDVVFQPV
jgi:hypothetical protein